MTFNQHYKINMISIGKLRITGGAKDTGANLNYIGKINITTADEESPIFVENLKVHLLIKVFRFSLNQTACKPGNFFA